MSAGDKKWWQTKPWGEMSSVQKIGTIAGWLFLGGAIGSFVFDSSETTASSFEIKIPESLDAPTRQMISEAWPKVKQVCSGLEKYSDTLQFKGVKDNNTIDIVFAVPDGKSSIPSNFMANGHFCYYGVSKDGKTLTVSKEGCKAICLGRAIKSGEPADRGDLVLQLK